MSSRLQLAKNAGADVCFIEGVSSQELLRECVKALSPTPVLVNIISGGITPSMTTHEAEASGAKIISEIDIDITRVNHTNECHPVFSLVSCVAAVHGIRSAMQSLKTTGSDSESAQGMGPKAFFEVMGQSPHLINNFDPPFLTSSVQASMKY